MKSTSTSLRSAALLTGQQLHHLDHLAPLCFYLDISLITDEEEIFQNCRKFYPQISVKYLSHHEFSLKFLAKNYDVLFVTSKYYRRELEPLIKLLFQKEMQFVYIPHGQSDKGHVKPEMSPFSQYDKALIYGELMEDVLSSWNILPKQTVKMGNLRYRFYQEHREFYDSLIQEEIFSGFTKDQPTILYAPTWQDEEGSSSFLAADFFDKVPKDINLIIKLHPLLYQHFPGNVISLEERVKNSGNILALHDFPLIYPLLNRCDAYLGDYSSIGYDFLAFDRPLYFIGEEKSPYLHRCGKRVSSEDPFADFGEDVFSENRRSLYQYAFGKEDTNLSNVKRLYI